MQLPSTLTKPSPGKLDMHLIEIVPGYLDAEKRVTQDAIEEPFQSFETNGNNNNNDHDISNDVIQIDNTNLANGSDCHHKSNASGTNARTYIPVDKLFFDRIFEFQQALRELRSEYEMQRAEINELRKENQRLKSELDRFK